MNSFGAIAFVVLATVIGKWLLLDDDAPEAEGRPNLRVADPPTEPETTPLSKSA